MNHNQQEMLKYIKMNAKKLPNNKQAQENSNRIMERKKNTLNKADK